ncbi:helix-turn-helix domain-containing protein [Aquibacillus sediminis]|uniref:helix-turn-helix domain-containing protein n=1 Tax=Aquibacillus sediminis TaxID=2574734 RepID=UPI001107D3F4|nr:helix-turn-helix transcriptional regulator [Aquibacillus sediminis]
MAQKELASIIGERLRLLRKKRGLSQEELAHLSCLHPTYIGQLERGEKNATLNTIEKVTSALEISIEELFQFQDPNNSQHELEILQQLEMVDAEDRATILKIIDVLIEWKKRTSNKSLT